MERLKRVAGVWSWLPAFRAVAETQHLPTASAELDVSPSALSRTIRLLETELGRDLFERQGRRIVLNEAGERLLVAVRDAMRRVHDGMSLVDTDSLTGLVHVGSTTDIATLVVTHAAAALHEAFAQVVPHLHPTEDAAFPAALLQGRLDVVFATVPAEDPNLTRVLVGRVEAGVFAPPEHPVLSARKLALSERPFVVWGRRDDGSTDDGWPRATPRTTAAVVTTAQAAASLAQRIGALVVLPEALARPAVERGELHAVRSKVQAVPVYAFHRHSLLRGGRAETLVEMARSAVASGLE